MTTINAELARKQTQNEWYFSSCLISGSAGAAIRDCAWLEPKIFINKQLSTLWEKTLGGIDPLSVANDFAGDFLTELLVRAARTPNLARPDEYARAISEASYGLGVVDNSTKIIKALSTKDYGLVRTLASDIGTATPGYSVATKGADQVGVEFNDVLKAGTAKHVLTRLPLDNDLGGLFGSEMIILAARPAMGKTALSLQIAKNVALDGKKVLFFSLEMARVALWARMACGAAGYSWKDVRIGNVSDAARAEIKRKSDGFRKKFGNNFIIDDESRTVSAIHMATLQINPDLVIVDHLGEIDWHNPNDNEVVWLGEAIKYMRTNISRRMQIPTIVIHQLNREVDKRADMRPKLSDLRWSGEIEQRADVVLMMYREDYYDMNINQSTVPTEVWTRKNRQGVMNSLTMMAYDMGTQNFSSMP